ncbi:response regulator transcription factor [Streptacidiphilus sp. PB12-B1b]|uniref:response regulator transcription factor n=1 Tax=Streptacidiphilus sp. PB12-B1b TaxID=2705012 RepID=UPI0015FA62FC|nr:response regulator transcription factor [Streptacidiphilus sp. PB12-B1b]QMU77922.1 response regulator transcription factor [Streptacidiphilus sp. PB12-B1b]
MSDSPAPIRVLVVDDQRVTREGLMLLVGLNAGMEVVGGGADGEQAVALARDLRADVVLMDLAMPGTDGLTATATLTREDPGVAVLVLTTYADDASVFPALRAGARGYLTKDAGAEQIEQAIRAVHAGQVWMDPVVQQRLVTAVTAGLPAPAAPAEPGSAAPPVAPGTLPDGLSAREAEVLTLIAQGLSNAEIGERLFLGRATVKTHVNRIFAKTGARDRAQAVHYAFRHGLAE